MALMRTSNPALNAKTFADVRRDPTAPAMTVEGTVNRTAFLLFLVVLPAAWVWAQVRTALIKPTEKFKLGVVAATGAIALFYVVGFVLSFFGIAMPFLRGNSTASIVVSGIIVVVAALNLILDFDFVESGAAAGAPKYM